MKLIYFGSLGLCDFDRGAVFYFFYFFFSTLLLFVVFRKFTVCELASKHTRLNPGTSRFSSQETMIGFEKAV